MPVKATPQPPKLLMEATLSRRPFFRRAGLSILGFIAALLAIWGLNEANNLGNVPDGLWLPLTIAIAVISLLFFIRALLNFIRWLRTKNETLKLFNQGIVRTRGKDT